VIPGAVNQSYYPTNLDRIHGLRASVSAENAVGAVSEHSGTTGQVAEGTEQSPPPEPPTVGSSAVSTVEYQVPVSGASAPFQMTAAELAKWAQKEDLPFEAAAIFPPDEPMGWPARDYKRATVRYLDEPARIVNTLVPSGGMSTTEYNKLNEVTRTLIVRAEAEADLAASKLWYEEQPRCQVLRGSRRDVPAH